MVHAFLLTDLVRVLRLSNLDVERALCLWILISKTDTATQNKISLKSYSNNPYLLYPKLQDLYQLRL